MSALILIRTIRLRIRRGAATAWEHGLFNWLEGLLPDLEGFESVSVLYHR